MRRWFEEGEFSPLACRPPNHANLTGGARGRTEHLPIIWVGWAACVFGSFLAPPNNRGKARLSVSWCFHAASTTKNSQSHCRTFEVNSTIGPPRLRLCVRLGRPADGSSAMSGAARCWEHGTPTVLANSHYLMDFIRWSDNPRLSSPRPVSSSLVLSGLVSPSRGRLLAAIAAVLASPLPLLLLVPFSSSPPPILAIQSLFSP